MRRKLDIIDSVPITQHTNYAIPLSIILADAKNLDWFYHHFIQIYSSEKMVGSVKRRIFYCDNDMRNFQGLEISEMNINKDIWESDMIFFLKRQIEKNRYILLEVDSFFLREREAYNQKHVNQKLLIYGFDDSEQIFWVKGFSKRFIFNNFTVKFDELKNTYKYMNESCSVEKLIFIKSKNEELEKFSLERFIKQVNQYRLSYPGEYKEYITKNTTNQVRFFGIEAFRDFEKYIEEAVENDYEIRYHDFHIFYEHKKVFYEKLKFINRQYEKNINIEEYKELVNKSNSLRLNYLKKAIQMKGTIYGEIQDEKVLINYKKQIGDIIDFEVNILDNIIKKLSNLI